MSFRFSLPSPFTLQAAGGRLSPTCKIGAETARLIFKTCHYDKQRDLIKNKLRGIIYTMRTGTFRPISIQIAYCAETGLYYLVDGQHRLKSICLLDLVFDFTIIYLLFDTKKQVDDHYAMNDVSSGRSDRQSLIACTEDERFGMSAYHASCLQAAVTYIYNGFSRSAGGNIWRTCIDTKKLMLETWHPYMAKYTNLLGDRGAQLSDIPYRSVVMAANLLALRYQEEKAKEFISGVISTEPRERTHPIFKCYEIWLTSVRKPDSEVLKGLSGCWNAYMRNVTQYSKVQPNKSEFALFVGTPFKGVVRRPISINEDLGINVISFDELTDLINHEEALEAAA